MARDSAGEGQGAHVVLRHRVAHRGRIPKEGSAHQVAAAVGRGLVDVVEEVPLEDEGVPDFCWHGGQPGGTGNEPGDGDVGRRGQRRGGGSGGSDEEREDVGVYHGSVKCRFEYDYVRVFVRDRGCFPPTEQLHPGCAGAVESNFLALGWLSQLQKLQN